MLFKTVTYKLTIILNLNKMNCINCNQRLNKSIFNSDRTKKSCPACSTKNGSQHVFYDYPEAFGVTDKRKSGKNPDGPQSYCTPCRGNKESNHQSYICDKVL